MKGYIAYDENVKGRQPGVLVVHEWWGLNEYARSGPNAGGIRVYRSCRGHVWCWKHLQASVRLAEEDRPDFESFRNASQVYDSNVLLKRGNF